MTNIELRIAAPSDAHELTVAYRSAYQVNRELGFPMNTDSVSVETVGEWIDQYCVCVAVAGERIVGGVRLGNQGVQAGKISRLGVHADWTHQGLGSLLLAFAETHARVNGCPAVWLTTPGEHPHLPEFYAERGYERAGEYPLDHREYDEIILVKQF